MTNIQGETLAIAIEGPYTDNVTDDVVFVPPWVLERLTLSEGDEVIMEAILEPLPKGEAITIKPLTGATVEGPMFLEGLTEALNQLGVIQTGILSAVVDPSLPELHQFLVENLTPNSVCLADGELRVEIERALDRPPTPEPVASPVAVASPLPEPEEFPASFLPVAAVAATPAVPNINPGAFVPFSGKGRRLDGKPVE
jgi:ubiquitin fusion degradation protein 1